MVMSSSWGTCGSGSCCIREPGPRKEQMKTYLVGRRNSSVSCDIEVPEHEKSVSRRHLELTLTSDGRCYIVHLNPENSTRVMDASGNWRSISQDYVELDAPLLLGGFQTTARTLLNQVRRTPPPPPPPPTPQPLPQDGGRVEWDPDRGTYVRF